MLRAIRNVTFLVLLAVAGNAAAQPPAVAPPPGEDPLAAQAYGLLKKYCYRCHGGATTAVPGLNVLDADSLVADRGPNKQLYLVRGKLEDSYIWKRAGLEKDMPPEDDGVLQPTPEERELIGRWITANAPFPGRPPRPFQSQLDVYSALRAHVQSLPPAERPFIRYFTLTHLFNNHVGVTEDEMRLYRAGLSKLINSLTWQSRIVIPQAIDKEGTIFAVDLRQLGWDKNDLWVEILTKYPYGLKFDDARDPALAAAAADVYSLTGSDMPLVRADWFIANASRTPLYEKLLELPDNITTLEKDATKLGVDVEQDFLLGRLARAGFTQSGVSGHNRLVDRHELSAGRGAYWKSYDFKTSEGTGNLLRFPLGPQFASNPFTAQAFKHDGGEMIWNLPNGLQGYYLADATGKVLDPAPTDVVNDPNKFGGTTAVVNGLSCMGCHRNGMIGMKDLLRNGSALAGTPLQKLHALAPSHDDMNKLVAVDEERFQRAATQACGPFLFVGEEAGKKITDFPEPITAMAIEYLQDVSAEEAAFELGMPNSAALKAAIGASVPLQQLGLGPLSSGGTIKRETWQSTKQFMSQFQRAANMLQVGTPLRVF